MFSREFGLVAIVEPLGRKSHPLVFSEFEAILRVPGFPVAEDDGVFEVFRANHPNTP